jgi:hypothetical protein
MFGINLLQLHDFVVHIRPYMYVLIQNLSSNLKTIFRWRSRATLTLKLNGLIHDAQSKLYIGGVACVGMNGLKTAKRNLFPCREYNVVKNVIFSVNIVFIDILLVCNIM